MLREQSQSSSSKIGESASRSSMAKEKYQNVTKQNTNNANSDSIQKSNIQIKISSNISKKVAGENLDNKKSQQPHKHSKKQQQNAQIKTEISQSTILHNKKGAINSSSEQESSYKFGFIEHGSILISQTPHHKNSLPSSLNLLNKPNSSSLSLSSDSQQELPSQQNQTTGLEYNNIHLLSSSLTDMFTNYEMHPHLKNFISGYLIFDIVVIFLSKISSKEFYIYFLFIIGGTLLDLIMLNDISVFNIYSGQFERGIVLGQFLNTCFLTMLVFYRLFRLFNVTKKFYQNFILRKKNINDNTSYSSTDHSLDYRNEQSQKLLINDHSSSQSSIVQGQNFEQYNSIVLPQLTTVQEQPIKEVKEDETSQDKVNLISSSSQNKTTIIQEPSNHNKLNKEQQNSEHDNNSVSKSLKMKAQIPQTNKNLTSFASKQQQNKIATLINSDQNTYQSQPNNINSNGSSDQKSQKISLQITENTIQTQRISLEKNNQSEVNKNEQNLNQKIVSSQFEENLTFVTSEICEDKNSSIKDVINQQIDNKRSNMSPQKEQKSNNSNQKKQAKSKQHKNKNLHSQQQSNTTLNQSSCENQSKSLNDLPISSISQIQETPSKNEIEKSTLDSFNSKNNIIQISDKIQEIHSTSVLEIVSRKKENSQLQNIESNKEKSNKISQNSKNIQSNNKNDRNLNKGKNNKVQLSHKDEQKIKELQNNDTKCNKNIENDQIIENQQNTDIQKEHTIKQEEVTIISLNNLSTIESLQGVTDPSDLIRKAQENDNKQKQDSQKQQEIQIDQQQNSSNTINSDNEIQTQTVEQNPSKTQQIDDVIKNEQSEQETFHICQDINNSNQLSRVNTINKSDQQFQDSKSDYIDVNYNHSIQSQTVYELIINTKIGEEEKQVIIQGTTSPSLPEIPSSLHESHGENSSPNPSPKHLLITNSDVLQIQNNINHQQQLNNNSEATTSGSNQNKSTSKFSCDQDEESSSEENNEIDSQHIYKEDQHFLEQAGLKNPNIIVTPSSLTQQSLYNSQRKLSDPKNKVSRKSIQQKNQNINSNTNNKTPIESPQKISIKKLSNNSSNSAFLEAQKIIQEVDYETIKMKQLQEQVELNDKHGETQNAYVEPNSFKLDPQNSSDLSNKNQDKIKRESFFLKKDSWESVMDLQQNDPDIIDYFANPLLEVLSLPFRSPVLYASSPKREQNSSMIFNGLLFQQIGNWNDSQQLNSITPPTQEQLKTSSNTLSPKYPSNYQASSDNQNDEVKQRKSTHLYSEEPVSDIEKLNQPPAWKIIAGEEENSSYDEYNENLQRDQCHLDNNPDLNQNTDEQNLEDVNSNYSQQSSQKNMNSSEQLKNQNKQEAFLFKPFIEKTEINFTQNSIFAAHLNRQNQLISLNNGQSKQFENKSLQFQNISTSNSQNHLGQDEVITNSELNNSFIKSQTNEQEYEQSISPSVENKDLNNFEQPLVIEIKGENNKVFEIVIENLSDIGSLFDEECSKNGINPEEILSSKITIITSLLQQSIDDADQKLSDDLTILLNELTLEHTLKSNSDIMTTELQEQLTKLICDQQNQTGFGSANYGGSNECQNNFYPMYSNFGYGAAYAQSSFNFYNVPSLLQNQNYSPPLYMNPQISQSRYQEFGDQIQLPEFNINANEIDSSHFIDGHLNTSNNNFGNGLFNNFIDLSRNSQTFQQSMGNMSPLLPNMSKTMGLKQQLQSRANGISQVSNQGNLNSAFDMDYFGSENRLDNNNNNNMREIENQKQQSNNFIQLTAQQSSTPVLQQNMKLDFIQGSPPINSIMMFGSTQQFGFQNSNNRRSIPNTNPHHQFINRSSHQFPSSHNFGNIASSSHSFGNIASSTFGDKQNPFSAQRINQLMPEPSTCVSHNNSNNQSVIKDQWKFNPSSITSTPLLQPIMKPKSQTESMPVNIAGKNQNVWYNSPQNPYLMDTPTPNLLNKSTSTINNQPTLFQSDLLAQLAQLGQPVK